MTDSNLYRIAPFVRYNPGNGFIVNQGSMAVAHIEAEIDQGLPTLLGDDSATADTHYVDLGIRELVLKTPSTARLEGQNIVGLPIEPCEIHIGADIYPCKDGVAELEFEHPGSYSVTVMCPSQLTTTFVVEITI